MKAIKMSLFILTLLVTADSFAVIRRKPPTTPGGGGGGQQPAPSPVGDEAAIKAFADGRSARQTQAQAMKPTDFINHLAALYSVPRASTSLLESTFQEWLKGKNLNADQIKAAKMAAPWVQIVRELKEEATHSIGAAQNGLSRDEITHKMTIANTFIAAVDMWQQMGQMSSGQ